MGAYFERIDNLKPLSHYLDGDKPKPGTSDGKAMSQNLLAAFLSRWPSDTPPPPELLPAALPAA